MNHTNSLFVFIIIFHNAIASFSVEKLVTSKKKINLFRNLFFAFSFSSAIILATSCNTSVSSDTQKSTDSTESVQKQNTYSYSDSSTYSNRPVDSTFAEPISGMVETSDSKKIQLEVFPSRDLKSCGLVLEDIKNGKRKKDVKLSVGASISFLRDYSGQLTINLFNNKNEVLLKNSAKCKGIMGDMITVNFYISENIDFSSIDYCTLGFEE